LQPDIDLTQGATEIMIDTTLSDFRAGGLAAIGVDGGEAALVKITAVQADRLILAEPLALQLPATFVAARRITPRPSQTDWTIG
jgi:hypothetical protein